MKRENRQDIKTLFSAKDIENRLAEMALEITKVAEPELLVVAILKGSFVFAADLIRAMYHAGLDPQVEFIMLSSYGVGKTSGDVKITKDIDTDVENRHVLIIDDILESGNTLAFAKNLMIKRKAKKVETAVLLNKIIDEKPKINAEYVGFECPDYFVVGYGMDVGYKLRELPFVGVVKE